VLSFFSSRPNWDPPSHAVCIPPLVPVEGHSRWGERGLGGPDSNEGTDTVYFVDSPMRKGGRGGVVAIERTCFKQFNTANIIKICGRALQYKL
jgi:hypothetical protein